MNNALCVWITYLETEIRVGFQPDAVNFVLQTGGDEWNGTFLIDHILNACLELSRSHGGDSV